MGTHIIGAHGEGSGTRRLFKAYTLVGAVVLAASLAWLSFSVTSADDASVSGIVITVTDPGESASSSPELLPGASNQGKRCSDNQGLDQSWAEFKLEGAALSEGPHMSGPLTVTISNLTEDSFDWESNIGLDAVIVKGGHAGTYLYRYDPPAEATSDKGLAVPDPDNNGISHISFCYDFPDDVAPTPESTPDPGTGVSSDPTPEPTLEPTPDPGTGVTNDPTPEPTLEPTPDPGTGVSSDPTPEPTLEPTPDPSTGVASDPTPELVPEQGTGVASDPNPEPAPEPGTGVASDPNPEPAPEPGTGLTSGPDPELAPGPVGDTSVAHVPTALPNTGGDPRADTQRFPTASMLSLAGLALIVLGGWAARRSRAQQGS